MILDAAIAAYEAERERAREDLLAAQAVYQKTIMSAGTTRDMIIMRLVDRSGRGTLARIAEHISMDSGYLSARLRRLRATTQEGVAPGTVTPGNTHTNTPEPATADAEADGQRRETPTYGQHREMPTYGQHREMPTDDSVSATGTTDPPQDPEHDHGGCVIVAHNGQAIRCRDLFAAWHILFGVGG